ncbi:hypothetical protein QYE76_003634 [Lolium multiflorum]|uniref:Reverse transcriptase zinc-binding domain-containing protein n=1 Tax=Lolium multiflorum TaxID=4521 RepID=A0AAD8RQK9_LOLMU|nr:hypothetical protein QYE76_003634 [Lolium multiflorum]
MELFAVADRLVHVNLAEGVEDSFRWRWEKDNSYSARSCYEGMFGARVDMAGALQIWKSRAPPNCRMFMWLAARNRCWTADRLSRRGLPHPVSCPCDQGSETLDHLLMGCVLAREVWAVFLRLWTIRSPRPQPRFPLPTTTRACRLARARRPTIAAAGDEDHGAVAARHLKSGQSQIDPRTAIGPHQTTTIAAIEVRARRPGIRTPATRHPHAGDPASAPWAEMYGRQRGIRGRRR